MNPTSPLKRIDSPKSQKTTRNFGKKNTPKRRVCAKKLDDVQSPDSDGWNDSGVGSASWLGATAVKNKKNATKPKYSRKEKSLVLKGPNKRKNGNTKNNTLKSRRNISSTTQNVDHPHNVQELEGHCSNFSFHSVIYSLFCTINIKNKEKKTPYRFS